MIDILTGDVFSRGNQATTCFVTIYPGCAIWHLVRKGRDLFLGSDRCGPPACQKRAGGLPQGQWSGKQARHQGFTYFSFRFGSPDLLTWKMTVLQQCVSRGMVKNSSQIKLWAFQTLPCLSQLFSYSERLPEFPPSTVILPLRAAGRLCGFV